MEHQIDYLYDAGKSYFIEIDGKKLEITKRLNKFDFLDPAKLSMFIDTLHDRLIRGEPIADLASTLNGASMFQILAHLYEDETFEYWVRDYARCIDSGISHFRDIFAHCFGFHYSSGHRKPTKLEDRMREYASALGIRIFYNSKVFYKEKVTQEELRLLNIARSSHYFVQEKGVEGSKVVFDINGIDISIGLSGKKRMHSADRVLQALEQLRVGLTLKDYETLMKGISALGKKASQAIISSFLRPEMEEYLKHLVHEIVVTNREPLYPASVVKAILGSFRSPYFNELLALLESFIPKVQDYLIDTSPQEMLAETDDWKIYGLVGGTFRQYQISFYGTPQLKTQVRSFLYAKAKPRVACQTEYACYIFTLAYYINLALAILDVELSIRIESILDLQPADVKMLTAFLAQHTNFAVKTQKNIIEEFRAFYNFCAPNKKASPFKRVQIPKKVNNPIRPASRQALATVAQHIDSLPLYVRIALEISIVTGARANSICQLTTDSLKKTASGYHLVVCGYKTALQQIIAGKTPYTIHKIPDSLAEMILDYVAQTTELRNKLPIPYIFVYQSKAREGSVRMPQVLNHGIFDYEMTKLFLNSPNFDEDGMPNKVSFRNLRAEVGRSMFAAGASEAEVSRKLGNTPVIARTHYASLYPTDEAKLYNQQYEATISASVQAALAEKDKIAKFPLQPRKELYGLCSSPTSCTNNNDCLTCSQRIVCIGGDSHDQPNGASS